MKGTEINIVSGHLLLILRCWWARGIFSAPVSVLPLLVFAAADK